MKNIISLKPILKIAGIITVAAVIGLTMAACVDPLESDLSGTITISPTDNVSIGMILTATYSGSEAVSYQWKKDGSNVGALSTTKPNKFTPMEVGNYTVTVSESGKKSKTSAAINVTFAYTSAAELREWLDSQPVNMHSSLYNVKLNVTSLGGSSATEGSVGNALSYSEQKLINLDLSGSSFTSVEDNAFTDCGSIAGITLPNTVTGIGEGAFYGCSSLLSITIPNSVTDIGDSAFRTCGYLESVTLGNKVERIGGTAFGYCNRIESINIPNSVTTINEFAFFECLSLASITIGNGVTEIDDRAFIGCNNLTEINVAKTAVLKILLPALPDSDIAKPFTVKLNVGNLGGRSDDKGSVGDAFSVNTDKYVNLDLSGSTFTSIDAEAFFGCYSLTGVIIPNSVKIIKESAFKSCTSLADIIIPNGVTGIESEAFYGCSGLTSIIIPASVTSLGANAFYDCTNLKSVTFLGTIHKESFAADVHPVFNGDLCDVFYGTGDSGTPGTYTTTDGETWTKQS